MPRTLDDPALTPVRRASLLSALSTTPMAQGEIVKQLDCARTTTYRAITDLADRGLLEETESGYVATPVGAALGGVAERYLDATEAVDRLEPVLASVDHPTLFDRWELLADADVTVSDRADPHLVSDRIADLIDGASRVRLAMTGATTVTAMSRIETVADGGDETTILFTPSALQSHRTVSKDSMDALEASSDVDLLVLEDLPFTTVLADDVAGIVGHDETTGIPVAMAETTDSLARDWIAGLFEDCRSRASSVRRER